VSDQGNGALSSNASSLLSASAELLVSWPYRETVETVETQYLYVGHLHQGGYDFAVVCWSVSPRDNSKKSSGRIMMKYFAWGGMCDYSWLDFGGDLDQDAGIFKEVFVIAGLTNRIRILQDQLLWRKFSVSECVVPVTDILRDSLKKVHVQTIDTNPLGVKKCRESVQLSSHSEILWYWNKWQAIVVAWT